MTARARARAKRELVAYIVVWDTAAGRRYSVGWAGDYDARQRRAFRFVDGRPYGHESPRDWARAHATKIRGGPWKVVRLVRRSR